MGIITLTSDWGLKDYYGAAVKGSVYTYYPQATVVDVSHLIPPFDIIQASLILKNSYRNFPPGTVHLVEVKAQAVENIAHLAILADGHYFIGADNGIFSLVLDHKPEAMIEILSDNHLSCFPARDIYVKAACHLAQGGKIEILGNPAEKMVEKTMLRPVIEESAIRGSIVYIDDYGNIITNISSELFGQVAKGRRFNIYLRRFEYEISSIQKGYGQVAEGEKLALFNSAGYLEIAINEGKASSLLGLGYNDSIRIDFYDSKNS